MTSERLDWALLDESRQRVLVDLLARTDSAHRPLRRPMTPGTDPAFQAVVQAGQAARDGGLAWHADSQGDAARQTTLKLTRQLADLEWITRSTAGTRATRVKLTPAGYDVVRCVVGEPSWAEGRPILQRLVREASRWTCDGASGFVSEYRLAGCTQDELLKVSTNKRTFDRVKKKVLGIESALMPAMVRGLVRSAPNAQGGPIWYRPSPEAVEAIETDLGVDLPELFDGPLADYYDEVAEAEHQRILSAGPLDRNDLSIRMPVGIGDWVGTKQNMEQQEA